MSEAQVTLEDGVKYGDDTHYVLTVRAPNTGMMIDARDAAERPVATPEGYQLLVSHSAMADEVLRRQVVRIGENIDGPLDLKAFRRLSTRDYDTLLEKAEALDTPLRADVEARGRPDGAGDGSANA